MSNLISYYTELAEKYCTDEGHLSLTPPNLNEKSKLRTDGVYVQFGMRPWWVGFNDEAYDIWYNVIRIFDDKHMVLLGKSINPFYPSNKELLKFGITDSENVIQTIQEIEKLPMDLFFNKLQREEHHGISGYYKAIKNNITDQLYLITPISGGKCACSILKSLTTETKDLGWAQFAFCNDDFTIDFKDDPNIIYDYGSPCRVESTFSQIEKDYKQTPHDFPSYFIPFDLSEKNRWEPILTKWNKCNNEE